MNTAQRVALLSLASGERDFWTDSVVLYRVLVMAGLARCRVDGMRNEFVRLTDLGRAAL